MIKNSRLKGRVKNLLQFSIGIMVILASLKWGNWNMWQRYYTTMLYIVAMNLLYKYFALSKFHLWKFSSNNFSFYNETACFLLHVFIINPLFTLIYLSNFPEENLSKKAAYILKWVVGFIIIEMFLLEFNQINYYNGWHLGWTIFFDLSMFIMLRLHFIKTNLAIFLSEFFTLFYLFTFGYFPISK